MRRRLYLTWLTGGGVAALCGVWATLAFEIRGQADVGLPELQPSGHRGHNAAVPTFDQSAFAAQLWNPKLQPSANPAAALPNAAERPRPPRLELIAIIKENGEWRAALYDMPGDRIVIVRSGDRVDENTITAVDAESVEIFDGRSSHRLALREDRS